MRIFSYILTALVTIFVINIALSFSLPAYRNVLINVRSNIFPPSKKVSIDTLDDAKSRENTRLRESLDRIDKHIESLSEVRKNTGTIVGTGTSEVSSGASLEENKESNIPLS